MSVLLDSTPCVTGCCHSDYTTVRPTAYQQVAQDGQAPAITEELERQIDGATRAPGTRHSVFPDVLANVELANHYFRSNAQRNPFTRAQA
jgi:hypothetical protein